MGGCEEEVLRMQYLCGLQSGDERSIVRVICYVFNTLTLY
jgi:hypothetical protein